MAMSGCDAADRAGWLRGPPFHAAFLGGPLIAGLCAVAAAAARPELFGLIVLPYLWLIGYPHLVATYTRLAAEDARPRLRRLLALEGPLLVLLATAALAGLVGTWALVTLYLYAQWSTSRARATASRAPMRAARSGR